MLALPWPGPPLAGHAEEVKGGGQVLRVPQRHLPLMQHQRSKPGDVGQQIYVLDPNQVKVEINIRGEI